MLNGCASWDTTGQLLQTSSRTFGVELIPLNPSCVQADFSFLIPDACRVQLQLWVRPHRHQYNKRGSFHTWRQRSLKRDQQIGGTTGLGCGSVFLFQKIKNLNTTGETQQETQKDTLKKLGPSEVFNLLQRERNKGKNSYSRNKTLLGWLMLGDGAPNKLDKVPKNSLQSLDGISITVTSSKRCHVATPGAHQRADRELVSGFQQWFGFPSL